MPLETLNSEGFLLTEIAGEWNVLKADFGNGYQAAACVGALEGTREWTIQIDVLPDAYAAVLPVETQTRAAYLWSFYHASKAADDAPFWLEVEDPETGTRKNYLVSFRDHKLSYDVLCARIYSTGLQLRERRQVGTVSPVPVAA